MSKRVSRDIDRKKTNDQRVSKSKAAAMMSTPFSKTLCFVAQTIFTYRP